MDFLDIDKPQEGQPCPVCNKIGKSNSLKFMYININDAVLKCESDKCMYPFRQFTYETRKHLKELELMKKDLTNSFKNNLKPEVVNSFEMPSMALEKSQNFLTGYKQSNPININKEIKMDPQNKPKITRCFLKIQQAHTKRKKLRINFSNNFTSMENF